MRNWAEIYCFSRTAEQLLHRGPIPRLCWSSFLWKPSGKHLRFLWTVKLNLLISPHFFILWTVWLLLFSRFACHYSLSSQSLLHASPTISFHLPPLSTLPIISFSSLCPLLSAHIVSLLFSTAPLPSSFLSPLNTLPPPPHTIPPSFVSGPLVFSLVSLPLSKTSISQGQVELMVFLTSLNLSLSLHTHTYTPTHTPCQHS